MQRIFTAEKITPTAVVVASIAVVGLLLAVALHAVLTRFQIVTEADGPAYRLDRLTGKLQIVTGQFSLPIEFTTREELEKPDTAPPVSISDSSASTPPSKGTPTPLSFSDWTKTQAYQSLTPEQKKQAPQRYREVFGSQVPPDYLPQDVGPNNTTPPESTPMPFAELVKSPEWKALSPDKQKELAERYKELFGDHGAYATAKSISFLQKFLHG